LAIYNREKKRAALARLSLLLSINQKPFRKSKVALTTQDQPKSSFYVVRIAFIVIKEWQKQPIPYSKVM
jgi:hypothetical protein